MGLYEYTCFMLSLCLFGTVQFKNISKSIQYNNIQVKNFYKVCRRISTQREITSSLSSLLHYNANDIHNNIVYVLKNYNQELKRLLCKKCIIKIAKIQWYQNKYLTNFISTKLDKTNICCLLKYCNRSITAIVYILFSYFWKFLDLCPDLPDFFFASALDWFVNF